MINYESELIENQRKILTDNFNANIKEIKTIGQLLDYVETDAKAKELIDYVTNLQQDNTMYARLKDEYEEEIKDLQQRIDKAIEYIVDYNLANSIILKRSYADLLKILKGDSND